jgi:hypothetical protein
MLEAVVPGARVKGKGGYLILVRCFSRHCEEPQATRLAMTK